MCRVRGNTRLYERAPESSERVLALAARASVSSRRAQPTLDGRVARPLPARGACGVGSIAPYTLKRVVREVGAETARSPDGRHRRRQCRRGGRESASTSVRQGRPCLPHVDRKEPRARHGWCPRRRVSPCDRWVEGDFGLGRTGQDTPPAIKSLRLSRRWTAVRLPTPTCTSHDYLRMRQCGRRRGASRGTTRSGSGCLKWRHPTAGRPGIRRTVGTV